MRVQSTRFALPSYSGNPPIFKKERLILCLMSSSPSNAWYVPAFTCSNMASRDAGRSCQREIRTYRRKCASTPTTHHPLSTEQTTSMHQEGSKPPGASGKSDSVLETSALDRPARDPFAMAPSGLSSFLEVQVESDFE